MECNVHTKMSRISNKIDSNCMESPCQVCAGAVSSQVQGWRPCKGIKGVGHTHEGVQGDLSVNLVVPNLWYATFPVQSIIRL